ncbi:MAG: CvpA family protein [Gemmatimonadota bacterium]
MNTLDIVIVVLCLGSAVVGAVTGPLRQISRFGGLALGLILARKYSGWAQDAMGLRFVHGDAVGYVAVLVAVYVAVRLLGYAVEHALRGDKLSGAERLTGALAGLVHGLALSVVAVFLLVAVLPRGAAIFRDATAAPAAITAAEWVQRVFPAVVREPFREKVGAAEGASPPAASPQSKKRSRK